MGRPSAEREPSNTMPLAITGRHRTATPVLRRYLEQRVQREAIVWRTEDERIELNDASSSSSRHMAARHSAEEAAW